MSVLEKIKARIARNKSVVQGPDRVSQILEEKQKNIANAKDLRFQQGELLKQQTAYRLDAPIRRLVLKAQALQHGMRIRRPQKSAIVHEVLASGEGRHEHLYMKLSNGQLLRADKGHKNPVLRQIIVGRLKSDTQDTVDFKTEITPAANV